MKVSSPGGAMRAFTPAFDGLRRNPGAAVTLATPTPHYASLHAGYEESLGGEPGIC